MLIDNTFDFRKDVKPEADPDKESKKLNSDWTTYTFAEITESLKRGPFGGDLKKSFFVENGYASYLVMVSFLVEL